MASRGFSKVIRPTVARQAVVAPAVRPQQQRTLVMAARNLVRAAAGSVAARSAVSVPVQQVRGVKTIDFAGSKEDVYGMTSFSL